MLQLKLLELLQSGCAGGDASGVHLLLQGLEHGVHLGLGLPAGGLVLQQHGLGQLLADAHDGVQGGQGVLEDHGDLIATDPVELVLADLQQVLAAVEDLTAIDDGVAGQDAHDGAAGNGLTGAGLTNDGEGLALVQIKADIPNGLHLTIAGPEGNSQIFNF